MLKRLRWWKTKEEIRELEWEARQKAIQECKKDLAWALEVDSKMPWTSMIDQAKLVNDIYKTWRGERI